MGKNKKEIIRKGIFVISLCVFIFSLCKLAIIFKGYRDNSKTYDELQQYAPSENTDENSGDDNSKPKFTFSKENYNELLNINSEFKGWLNVPNTDISYPIVQAEDNDYYLTHNFKKANNAGGAIFISCDNEKPFEERNTTIHGHNMKDGSMFASLSKFAESDFFNKNRTIYVALENEVLEYEVFSVYEEAANINPYTNFFNSDDEFIQYLNSLKSKSMYGVEIDDFNKDDKIITLSTCAYDINDGRLLVHGRLVNREKYEN